MLKKYRKQLFISGIIVFLFFFVLFVGSFFYFKKDNDSLQVDYSTSNEMKLKDLLPVSDSLGKTFTGEGTEEGVQGYTEFSIENLSSKNSSYEVYITEEGNIDQFSKIRGDYIKFYLTDKNDNPFYGFESRRLPTYNELPVLADKPEAKLLYRGVVSGNTQEELKLRVWLSDSYAINSSETKEFMIAVHVRTI